MTDEPPPAAGADPIDWAALEQRYGRRQAWIDKLLKLTIQEYAPVPALLREAVRLGDAEQVGAIAHRIKNGTGAIEAKALFELARCMEHRVRRGGDQPLAPMALEAADQIERLVALLRVRFEPEFRGHTPASP